MNNLIIINKGRKIALYQIRLPSKHDINTTECHNQL